MWFWWCVYINAPFPATAQGTPEKLIEHLMANFCTEDTTYPEDFLLTYRTFLDSPRSVVDRLLSWHMHSAAPSLRRRVRRIVLLWVHNHFNDFEESPEMMRFVERFDELLMQEGSGESRCLPSSTHSLRGNGAR